MDVSVTQLPTLLVGGAALLGFFREIDREAPFRHALHPKIYEAGSY